MIKRVKGDSFTLLIKVNDNITDWKIRCEIYDCAKHKIELATLNSGGSDDQIFITDVVNGKFSVYIPSGLTTDFEDNAKIELEADTGAIVGGVSEILTIFQDEILFNNQKITWISPS